jgi:hypothetical protein
MTMKSWLRYHRIPAVLALTIVCLCMPACLSDPHVSIDGKVTPTFKLSGQGNLHLFWINELGSENELAQRQLGTPVKATVWEIVPDQSTSNRISELPAIHYGEVPAGFKQTIPKNGLPPPLKEGVVYSAGGPTYNAETGAAVLFLIREGKSVEVPMRHLY